MNTNKNLVMGVWARNPPEGLAQFIASLRQTTFQGDVCIFADHVAPDVVRTLLRHGVLVERLDAHLVPHQTGRFFSYLNFLARYGESYANVMISDVRDVLFQSDPFANPLPADIVFAQERCLIGASPIDRRWIEVAFGEAVAHNLRDFPVSSSGVAFGTLAGMLRYLVAMTTEMADLPREALLSQGIAQGIHNYVVRMRPLLGAWCDPTESLVSCMSSVPRASIQMTDRGALVDGRLVPVIHQWDRHEPLVHYVRHAPQFRLQAAQPSPATAAPVAVRASAKAAPQHAVVAYYHRPRDAGWLAPFLSSLRVAGFAGAVHCVGAFDAPEMDLLAGHDATPHQINAPDRALEVENVAHLFLSQVLDQLANEPMPPDQVLVSDSVRGAFLRDPFQGASIGVSLFLEGVARIGDSDFNLQRLAFFGVPDEGSKLRPIVSSALVRGELANMRAFYRRLLAEFIGRAELLRVHKSIQGAFNKLAHSNPGLLVIVHPNGGEAYLDSGEGGLTYTTEPAIRIGGAVPFVVLNPEGQTGLMRALRARTGIA